MLSAPNLRNRYQALPNNDPIRDVTHNAPPEARQLVEDALETRGFLPAARLCEAGVDELSSRVASGHLSHRAGLVSHLFAQRLNLGVRSTEGKVHYAEIPETKLALRAMSQDQYKAFKTAQRCRPNGGFDAWLAGAPNGGFSAWLTGKTTSRAGYVEFPLSLYPRLDRSRTDSCRNFLPGCLTEKLIEHGAARGRTIEEGLRLVSVENLETIVSELVGALSSFKMTLINPEECSDLLRVVYAEGMRETCLLRAEMMADGIRHLLSKRELARQQGDREEVKSLNASIGVSYASLAEQTHLASTYGNLYYLRRNEGPKQELDFKKAERDELVSALQSSTDKHISDEGARNAWLGGHPHVQLIDQDIKRLTALC